MKYETITISVSERAKEMAKAIANYYNSLPDKVVDVSWQDVLATEAENSITKTHNALKKVGEI